MALGTGVAWLYSMSVNLWPQWFPMEARHLYYEASAMIIGLINLGHMLEARTSAFFKGAGEIARFNSADGAPVTDEGEKRATGGSAAYVAAPDDRRSRTGRWRDYPGRSMAG